MKAVQPRVAACEYSIPSLSTSPIDFQKVNLAFTSDQMLQLTYVHYVGSKDQCDAVAGGWYYDVPPNSGKPMRIVACDKTCSQLTAMSDVAVQIKLGCATR